MNRNKQLRLIPFSISLGAMALASLTFVLQPYGNAGLLRLIVLIVLMLATFCSGLYFWISAARAARAARIQQFKKTSCRFSMSAVSVGELLSDMRELGGNDPFGLFSFGVVVPVAAAQKSTGEHHIQMELVELVGDQGIGCHALIGRINGPVDLVRLAKARNCSIQSMDDGVEFCFTFDCAAYWHDSAETRELSASIRCVMDSLAHPTKAALVSTQPCV